MSNYYNYETVLLIIIIIIYKIKCKSIARAPRWTEGVGGGGDPEWPRTGSYYVSPIIDRVER